MVKIKDEKKLQQGIENDPIIRDHMAYLNYLLVCTFGNFIAAILIAANTVKNVDVGHEQSFEKRATKVIKKAVTKKCLL